MTALEKRLMRVLAKLLANPEVLFLDESGDYAGDKSSQPKIKIPAALAKYAVSSGLLISDGKSVRASDTIGPWLSRMNAIKSNNASDGDQFNAQHWRLQEREVFDEYGGLNTVQVNVQDSPLLGLYRQHDKNGNRFLSAIEFAAGEKLRNDYVCSNMGRMAASNWSGIRQDKSAARSASAADEMHNGAIDAKRRVMNALTSLGPVLDRVLFCVLLREQGLSSLEQDCHWPNRSGKVVLKIALTRLADHYGLRG